MGIIYICRENKNYMKLLLVIISLIVIFNFFARNIYSVENNNMDLELSLSEIYKEGVSVKQFGAVGDGKSDDTKAFKDAVLEARDKKMFVYVPGGSYRLTEAIAIGSIPVVGYSVKNWPEDKEKLPTLIIDQTERPGIILFSGSISGLHITYENNSDEPAVSIPSTGGRVSNVWITNAGTGIRFIDTSDLMNPGRSNIQDVLIENVRQIGVYFSGTLDVPYAKNVSVISSHSEFAGSGIGFQFVKNDNIRMSYCYVNGAYSAFQFDDVSGRVKQSTWGSLDNCVAENVEIGILVNSGMPETLANPVTFTNGRISAIKNALKVNEGRMQLTVYNSVLISSESPVVSILGGDSVLINNSVIKSNAEDKPVVEIDGAINAIVNNCVISGDKVGIIVGGSTKNIIITNNTIEVSDEKIDNRLVQDDYKVISGNK